MHHFTLVFLFGLLSGTTLLITGNTLNFWLATFGISKEYLGLFSMIALPYSLNFLWAYFFDCYNVPIITQFLGKRLSWITALSVAIAVLTLVMSCYSPRDHLIVIACLGISISFLSTSKDAVLGALRSEILSHEEQATTSGIYILGYRIGMLLSSSGSIILSTYTSWMFVYRVLAFMVLILTILILLHKQYIHSKIYKHSVVQACTDQNSWSINYIINKVGGLKKLVYVLLFLILYRLPDNMISIMSNAFLLDLKFTPVEIAFYCKTLGTVGSILGSIIASIYMKRLNIKHSLFAFSIVHLLAHSLIVLQSIIGKNIAVLAISVCVESITGGMCMSAYIAFITYLCVGEYRATQYSIYTCMMGLSRTLFPSVSGFVVHEIGWTMFFVFCMISTIPSMIMCYSIAYHNKLNNLSTSI